MNVGDSGNYAGILEAAGYEKTEKETEADIILVNTCVVRQGAEDRAAWYITSMKNFKLQKPNLKIGVCGCIVTEPGRTVEKDFPHVDIFIPPNSPDKLFEYLNINSSLDIEHSSLYVTIMRGCDNFCSYCIVPYVRGREESRPMDEVLSEIKGLIEQGITDITLLGQNVNSYKYGLANLLREINRTLHASCLPAGKARFTLHFLTSHPRDMSDEIVETVAELPCVARDFFMPLQSGDDEILKRMNRGYTLAYYIDRVKKIRSLMPDARISSDLLVGFPGETEEQFQNTLRAVERLKFNEVHMFAYSGRPGVAAAKMQGQLPDEVKRERLQRLIALVREAVKA